MSWPQTLQSVFSALGLNATVSESMTNFTNSSTTNATTNDNTIPSMFAAPLAALGALTGGGDISTLATRFLQFGALGSVFNFLSIGWIFWWAYDWILSRFVLTIHLDGEEMPSLWLMLWLSKQKAWTSARDIQVSSQNFGLGTMMGTLVPGEDTAGKEGMRPLSILPWNNTTHSMWYKNRLMRVTRTRQTLEQGRQEATITIQMFTRSHHRLYDLLLEAKQQYEAEIETRVVVYILDSFSNWYYTGARPKRPLDSVIIPQDIKELLVEDCKDFMDSEAWYGQRGIAWQRGWLLYGAPGSGKTSTIQALAGELGLHIYVVSLSKRGMDDAALNTLINGIPGRAIILIEDIDAAFAQSTREVPIVTSPVQPSNPYAMNTGNPAPSSVTLSGLLNAIDGVQAQQGRLLFATTNKYEALDPALTRPGRLDLHIEFKNASKWQAAQLFKNFYPLETPATSRKETIDDVTISDEKDQTSVNQNGAALVSTLLTPEPTSMDSSSGQPHAASGSMCRGRKAPRLSQQQLEELAVSFGDAIPDEELSMAAIQGHLMMHKTRPLEAVRSAPSFVVKERERRIRAREITREAAEKEAAAVAAAAAEREKSDPTATASSPASTMSVTTLPTATSLETVVNGVRKDHIGDSIVMVNGK